eukprot:2966196-Rhodomonas_salina.1
MGAKREGVRWSWCVTECPGRTHCVAALYPGTHRVPGYPGTIPLIPVVEATMYRCRVVSF